MLASRFRRVSVQLLLSLTALLAGSSVPVSAQGKKQPNSPSYQQLQQQLQNDQMFLQQQEQWFLKLEQQQFYQQKMLQNWYQQQMIQQQQLMQQWLMQRPAPTAPVARSAAIRRPR